MAMDSKHDCGSCSRNVADLVDDEVGHVPGREDLDARLRGKGDQDRRISGRAASPYIATVTVKPPASACGLTRTCSTPRRSAASNSQPSARRVERRARLVAGRAVAAAARRRHFEHRHARSPIFTLAGFAGRWTSTTYDRLAGMPL